MSGIYGRFRLCFALFSFVITSKFMLRELPFYHELNIARTSKTFKGYPRIHSIEIIDLKDPLVQLTIRLVN